LDKGNQKTLLQVLDLLKIRMTSVSEKIKGLVSVVTRTVTCGVSVLNPTQTSEILAGEYACI